MITLTDNPGDYDLPFPDWYENQKQMCERTLNLDEGEILILEAPTGSGKSMNPALVSHFRRGSTVCMGTRDLQIQYRDTFPDLAIVWGQSHYPCVHPGVISEYREAYGETPTRADCTYRKPKDCEYYRDCPYELSKIQALRARAKVSNYAYAYYTKWWRPYTNDLFCDEAHKLPDVLSDLISVEIAERTRSWFELPGFPFVSGGTKFAYDSISKWTETAVTSLSGIRTQDLKKRRRIRQMILKLKELFTALTVAQPGDWYVASGQALGKLIAKPIIPGKFAKRILDEHARSITLMSATIGDPEVLVRELGLGEYQWLTLPHIFPRENRPVLFYKNAPRINARSGADVYNAQVDLMAKILRSHAGHKGVIHTVSWKHTKTLARLLTKRGLGERLYIPEGERTQSINGFKESDGDRVAISPSWHEGLNFQDELARFAVIAKIPYKSLGDPVVKLRLQSKGGNSWYRWKAALGVVQAAGRIVRHKDDWGVTHIVDGEWSRVRSKAPAWFEVDDV